MKVYKVNLGSKSAISKLPDAQTIFGTVCTILKETQGEEELMKYLNSFSSEPLFIHSSMFYSNVFPMVKKNISTVSEVSRMALSVSGEEVVQVLNEVKKNKKIEWMSATVFNNYVLNNTLDELNRDIYSGTLVVDKNVIKVKGESIHIDHKEVLTTRVSVDAYNPNDGDSKSLFYDQSLFHEKSKTFSFYIKTSEKVEKIERILKCLSYYPMGNRKTVGKNLFDYISMEEVNIKSKCAEKVLLSKYFPDAKEVDIKKSRYSLHSYISKTSNGGIKNKVKGKMTFFTEGSIIRPYLEKEYYGNLLPIEMEELTIYHYGIGFII